MLQGRVICHSNLRPLLFMTTFFYAGTVLAAGSSPSPAWDRKVQEGTPMLLTRATE